MEIEIILRVVAVVIAAVLLLSSFDYSTIILYIRNLFKKKSEIVVLKEDVEFLDVIESWHILRNQCKELDLDVAIEKLDEVFPLLNLEE